jgi:DNA-binding IclR family transcriptional regulator
MNGGPKREINNEKTRYKPAVPAVEAASRVLMCLGESPGFQMKLTEICKQVGIHKSKGYSILSTLEPFGFVVKDPETKTYCLGPGLIFLSRHVLDHLNYPTIVAPFLESLARETNGTAAFGLINGRYVFVVSKYEVNQKIGFSVSLGDRFHITLGAHGKAIAAFLPVREREKLLVQKSLHFHGEPGRLNITRLREELARCRELGYAEDMGEITHGVNVVSAPVFGHREKIVGCIILIGTFTKNRLERYGSKAAVAAREVSYRLGADIKALY